MLYESQYYGVCDLGFGVLYHHGIKGQRWGIRRYQNPDGSLTPAGKARYAKLKNKTDKKIAKEILKNDLLTENNLSGKGSRVTEAADLGIRALQRMGRLSDGEIDDVDRAWFVFEDQTVGLLTIADQINRGKTKEAVKKMVDDANSLDYKYEYEPGLFQLRNAYKPEPFIDACYEIRSKNANRKV